MAETRVIQARIAFAAPSKAMPTDSTTFLAAALMLVGAMLLAFTAGRLVQYRSTLEMTMSQITDALKADAAEVKADLQTVLGLLAAHATNADLPAQIQADSAEVQAVSQDLAEMHSQIQSAIATYQPTAPTPSQPSSTDSTSAALSPVAAG